MHPPRPMPSKNWWKVRAAINGFIVLGLCEAPNAIPIITEWTIIPNSNTCNTIYSKQKWVIISYVKQTWKYYFLCYLWIIAWGCNSSSLQRVLARFGVITASSIHIWKVTHTFLKVFFSLHLTSFDHWLVQNSNFAVDKLLAHLHYFTLRFGTDYI